VVCYCSLNVSYLSQPVLLLGFVQGAVSLCSINGKEGSVRLYQPLCRVVSLHAMKECSVRGTAALILNNVTT
jgi:hypothetical protein